MTHELDKIPYLGIGIGLRSDIAAQTLLHSDEIEVLEIISEHYFSYKPKSSHAFLSKFLEHFSIIPHGVKLSIGSVSPLEEQYLKELKILTKTLHAHYYSDHFALTRFGEEIDTNHLSPLWYTHEMLEHVIRRVDTLQQTLGIPLVLENITAPFDIPEADFEEPEFITQVCERTGCGLLMDVTNVHINSYNRRRDPIPFLSRYPIDSIIQIHLAGGELQHGIFSDTHSQEISGPNEGVWELFSWIVERAKVKAVVIERDQNFGLNFDDMILKDLRRARSIVEAATKTCFSSSIAVQKS